MTNDAGQSIANIGTDPDAFEAFYRQHLDDVAGFVARRVNDPYLAADLTSDIFLKAIDAADRYHPSRGAPGAWLIGIARNVIADDQRRRAREGNAASRLHGRRELGADAILRIEERIDAERELRSLYAALGQLSSRDRHIFELVAVDGLSVTEAAQVLGIKPATARVRLHRARTRLSTTVNHQSRPTTLATVFSTEEN